MLETHYPIVSLPENPNNKIIKKKYKTSVCYEVWNYDKHYFCYDENRKTKNCRSVIFSDPQKKILSYSPGKTIFPSVFCKKYKCDDNIYIDEYIDGTLIHLFYDDRIDSWEIASKGAVGGKYSLGKNQSTLRNLFIESLTRESYSKENDLSTISLLEYFPKNYCFTFTLLHPENEIVYLLDYPMLYLTAIYDINRQSNKVINIPSFVFQTWDFLQSTTILFPLSKTFSSWDDLQIECSISNTIKYNAGYMAYHVISGERCIFKNQNYELSKTIEKIDPELILQYLCFRRMKAIHGIVELFPDYKRKFHFYREFLHKLIFQIYKTYLAKYVWKMEMDNLYPEIVLHHVNAVHYEIYIPSLKMGRKKQHITCKIIHDYIMKKPPGEILYMLFHTKRNKI